MGCELIIVKLRIISGEHLDLLNDDDGDVLDELLGDVSISTLNPHYTSVQLNVSTKHILVHTYELTKESILSLETELYQNIIMLLKKLKGRDGRFIHTIKVSRTGSYIKTSENTIILNVG